VVIVSYPNTLSAPTISGLAYSTGTNGSSNWIKFTSGTGTVTW
jgi:hypothetical protein